MGASHPRDCACSTDNDGQRESSQDCPNGVVSEVVHRSHHCERLLDAANVAVRSLACAKAKRVYTLVAKSM